MPTDNIAELATRTQVTAKMSLNRPGRDAQTYLGQLLRHTIEDVFDPGISTCVLNSVYLHIKH